MKKFLVLYSSTVSASEQMKSATPEQAKAGMDAWMAWAQKAGPAIVDLGMPLGSPLKIADGKVGASESKVAGFSILQGESGDAVSALLRDHPHSRAPGAWIDVLELLPLPGM